MSTSPKLSILRRSVWSGLAFELRSALGRAFARRVSIDRSATNYLNLGSGDEVFADYINVDIHPLPLIGRRRPASYIGADLRYPLPFEDETFDAVFSEHTFEHLTFDEAERLMHETFRVTKRQGRVRLIVPDLSLFIEAYARNDRAWFAEWERIYFTESEDAQRRTRRLITPMNAISFVTQEYGHMSAWDFETMKAYLEQAGFANVEQLAYAEGKDPRLLRDMDADDRRLVSLYVEAVRP